MLNEKISNNNKINFDNISRISALQYELSERRICEIAELTKTFAKSISSLLDDDQDIYSALSIASNGISFSFEIDDSDVLDENKTRLKEILRTTCAHDAATFCEILIDQVNRSTEHTIGEHSFLFSESTSDIIAYVKNQLSDEAYDVFSQDLTDPRVKYENSIKDAVRDLIDGEVGYVLLPLEERGGMRLPTISEIIYRNDLKINAVTPVFGFDGNADMRYALISRSFSVPPRTTDDDRYLEIYVDTDASIALSDVLLVAKQRGHSLYRLNTFSMVTEEGNKSYYSIVLRDDGADFTPLLVYLTLFSDDFSPVGMYKNLE